MYESFARLLQDAFDDCLYRMSLRKSRTELSELSALDGVVLAAKRIPDLFESLLLALEPFGESGRFQNDFSDVAERTDTKQWVRLLLDHHLRIQRRKPPNGKRPWFEAYKNDSYLIRTGYIRDAGGRHDNEYVHQYRTSPLWSFAQDLKLVD